MKKLLHLKRVWIITLVFLLFAGLTYADYTLEDGTVVQWAGGDTLNVINTDGTSYSTTGIDNGSGRLVPNDDSFSNSSAWSLPTFNDSVRNGMNNTNMTVPIMVDGTFSGWADIYGSGIAYQNNTAVRNSSESQGNSVGWNGINNGYGGGVINITTPSATTTTPPPSSGGGSPPSGATINNGSPSGVTNGGSNNTYIPPYIPPVPYVTSVSVSGPNSVTAAQSYSYTATATYNNGNTVDVTGSSSWSNGSTFIPQNEGTYTVSATYAGVTGSKQVNVVLPPAAAPPAKPPVRLY